MKTTSEPLHHAGTAVPAPLFNRTLPGAQSGEDAPIDSLNLLFIVGFAVLITVLARYLSTKGRRK